MCFCCFFLSHWNTLYTCQLFPRYRSEIFILGVLRFLKTTLSFPKIPDEFRSLPKNSKVFRRIPKSSENVQSSSPSTNVSSQCFSLQKSEIARKVLSFIHYTHGFRSLHGSELTHFWKLRQARGQQLTFFNQAWEIGPQAWVRVRSKFSTRRRETHAQGVRVGRYTHGVKNVSGTLLIQFFLNQQRCLEKLTSCT